MVILLVDDSRVQRRANEGALVRAGYKVITASDGVEGLKVARSALPDVILLDMMLPKMSGPDVLRELKADPATAHIPVLVLTGLSQTNESKLMSEGAAGFFQKSDHMLEGFQPSA
jgi:CheY-like chemotaxis protein